MNAINPAVVALDAENFAVQLTDSCATHAAWLSVMRFGMGTLLENQPLVIELIVREAVRELNRMKNPAHVTADVAARIFRELGLRLVPMNNPQISDQLVTKAE